MTTEPTVFVVDDDAPVRKSLDLLIKSVGLPVETYASAQEFLDHFDPERPGCLVLDVRMPRMSGIELQDHFRAQGVQIPIIFVSGHGDVPIAVRAIRNGAVQFLEKPFSKQLLLEHIHEAMNLDARQREQKAALSEVQSRLDRLTERERQVMDGVVAGKVSKEVAAELGISKKTVDVHRARVMNKLGIESVAELVEMAVKVRPTNELAVSH